MANDIEFKIVATDNGTFKIVTVAAKALNSELDKTAKAHAKAAKESDLHANTQAKGAMGAGSAGRDFGKLAQSINGGSGSLVGAYATLAANIFAVGAAFNALKSAAQMTQLQEGIDRMGNRMGITLSQTAYNVRDLSGGMLTLEQSFRSTAQAAAGGIKSTDIEKLAKLAKDASYALGRDMPDSMDRLTKGVLKLEPELLDELGIMTRLDQSNRTYALTLGKTVGSLTAVEKQTGFMNAVLAEGNAKMGGLSDNAAGTGLAKLAASFADLTAGILKFINIAAEPLAALFSASPGSMAGGALMFASTIAKQLVPGLKTMTDETLQAAKASKELALQKVFETKITGDTGVMFTKLSNDYRNGSADAGVFADKTAVIKDQIEQLNKTLEQNKAANKIDETIAQKIADRTDEYNKLAGASKSVAAAEQANSLASLESALSSGDLIDMGKKLAEVYKASATHLEANNAGATAGRRAMNGLAFGFDMVNISARAAGIAIMEALNIIGIIITVVSMAVDAFKFLYRVMVGEDVIKAQENLTAVTDQLNERIKEYNKIRESTATASVKELASSKLLTNTLMEQVNAVDALAAANKKKDVKPIYSTVLTTEGIKKDVIVNQSDMNAGAERSASKTRKVLQDLAKTDIPEYNAAIVAVAGSQEKFNNIVNYSGTGAQLLTLLDNIGSKMKNYFPVIEEFSGSLKELSTSYDAFIKAATPTTPYDQVEKSLTRTTIALSQASIEMSNGVLNATKLGDVLSSIDPSTLATMGAGGRNEEDIANINALITLTDQLQVSKAKLLDLDSKGQKYGKDGVELQKSITELEEQQAGVASKALFSATSLINAEQHKYAILKKQSIENSANLAVAQAHLTVLNSYTSLSGAGAIARIDAENNIKEIQGDQFRLQIETQKVAVSSLQTQLEMNKAKLEALDIASKFFDLSTQTTKNDAQAQLKEIENKIKLGKTTVGVRGGTGVTIAYTPEELQGLKDIAANLQLQISLQDQIANGTAARIAAEKQLKALRSTETGTTVRSATGKAGEAAGIARVTEATKASEEKKQALISKTADLQDLLTGTAKENTNAYKKLDEAQKATLEVRKKAIIDANDSEVKALQLEQAKALAANKTDTQSRNRWADLVKLKQDELGTSLQQLSVDDQIALATTLQIKNTEQLAQAKLDSLNAELNITNKISEANNTIFKNNREMAKIKRDLSGIAETPTQSAALAREEAQHTYDTAKAVQGIKLAIIDAEYALLKAQLLAAKDAATIRNKDIDTQISKLPETDTPGRAALELQKTDIGSLDTILTAIPLAAAAAKEASESSLKLLEAQIKAAGGVTGVSGIGPKVIMGSAPVASGPNLAPQEGPAPTDALSAITGTITQAAAIPEVKDPFNTFRAALLTTQEAMVPFTNLLASLGPDGELIGALSKGMFTIGDSFASLGQLMPGLQTNFSALMTNFKKSTEEGGGFNFKAMFASDTFADFAKGAQQALGAVSSIIGQIGAIYAASSKQKIAGIDKEIAAEQKRDGKSAESIAKIKALETKKEAIAKKAFEMNKKIMIAQAIMSTAAGIAGALAAPFGLGIPLAILVGAMGAAQIALIAGTSYESGSSSGTTPSAPTTLSIGKRSDSVDLAKSNTSAGGEVGFISGSQGTGSSASTFRRAAYGDNNTGRAGFIVGEKGPELFTPSVPGSITPNDKMSQGQSINATINIQAIDSAGVEELLTNKRGHIIGMLREAANANGQKFLENVDTKKYSQGGRRL